MSDVKRHTLAVTLALTITVGTGHVSAQQYPLKTALDQYVMYLTVLVGTLKGITDADTAQVKGTVVDNLVKEINLWQSQIEWYFSIAAADSKAHLDASAGIIENMQTALAQEKMRLANDCGLEGTLTSQSGDTRIRVNFRNTLSVPVRLYWLDYNGKRVDHGLLEPGQVTGNRVTYLTHPWLFANASGDCIGVALPIGNNSTVDIRPSLWPSVAASLQKLRASETL